MLDALESNVRQPALRERIRQVRRDGDVACRANFELGLKSRVEDRFARMPGHPDDAEINQLEQTARDLRRVERAGRRLGDGSAYDAALKRTAAGLGQVQHQGLVERMRLTEILVGTEEALSLLAT